MKKPAMCTYNIVAFVVLPIVIILMGVFVFICFGTSLTAPTIDYDKMTSQTQSGELWEELAIVDGEYAYIIYSVDEYYEFDENELIAFQGSSIEEIRNIICECAPGAYVISYWEGDGQNFNFTSTYDFKQYLEEIKSTSYYDKIPNIDVVNDNFSNITLYDLSEYRGYERDYNNGVGIVRIFGFLIIAGITLAVVFLEAVIAVILKFTVFKPKKQNTKI